MVFDQPVKLSVHQIGNLALQGYSRAHPRGTRARASPETNQRAMRRMVTKSDANIFFQDTICPHVMFRMIMMRGASSSPERRNIDMSSFT